MTTANDLNAEIDRVFPRSSPPADVLEGGQDYPPHELALETGFSDEAYTIRSFWKKGWWEISPEHVNAGGNSYEYLMGFCYLTTDAFRYYLPVLLRLAMDELRKRNPLVVTEWTEFLGRRLTPDQAGNWGKEFEIIYSPLPPAQKRLIAKIVNYIKSRLPDEKKPIITSTCEAYWEKFDDKTGAV